MSRHFLLACAVFAISCSCPLLVGAAETKSADSFTTVYVKEMCGGCIKKIQSHFASNERVGEIDCRLKTKSVIFRPSQGKELTARYLWKEMDKIGKTPVKLIGPEGTFTVEPPAK